MKYRNFIPKVTSRNGWKALAILIVGLVLTAASVFYIERNIELQSKHELVLICNEIQTKIAARLHAHAQLLRDGSALFAANDTVTRNEWKLFIEHSKLNRNLPGIQGVGFSYIIQKEHLQRHIQNIRNEGFADYNVKPAGVRELYTSIIYLEPFTGRNLRAFGYDMFSEPIRRKAMEEARDFDVAALSGKVILVQETDKDLQAGTLMFVPVYRNALPTTTVAQRRAAIIGWVYSPYRMYDLMYGILGSRDSINDTRIHLQVYDNDRIDSKLLLFDSQINDTINQNNLSTRTVAIPIGFNEKKWTLLVSQPKERFSYFQSKVLIVLFSGIAISFLLFSLSLTLFNTRYRAQQIAAQMTSELKESEEKHRLLIENSHDIIYTLTSDGVFIFVSQAWTALLGYPVNQVSGQPFQQFVHPDDLPGCFVFLQKVIKSGQRQEGVEYRVRHTDGTWYWHTSSAVPLRDKDGKVIGFEGTARDITERKLAEENLRYSEAQLQMITNNFPDGIIVLHDQASRYIFAEGLGLKDIGFTKEMLLGKSPQDLFPPEFSEVLEQKIDDAFKGKKETFEIKLGEQYFTETVIPVKNKNTQIVAVMGVITNISNRKRMEDLLNQTRYNYETFFNTIDEFLFVLDEQGNIIQTNSTVIDRLGFTREELSGKSVLMVHPLERRDEAAQIVGEMLNGTSEFCPVPIVTKSGVQIPVETRVSHGFWDGKPAIFGVTKDISKVKLSEEKFSKLFHLNPSACGLSDFYTHKYIEVNEAFYSLLGYEKNEVIGKTATDLAILTPEAINAIMLKADSYGNVTNAEANLMAKNGDIKRVLISAENINVQDKKYRFTVVHDITERRQIEETLQNERLLLRMLIDNIPYQIYYKDMESRFVFCNPAVAHNCGANTTDEMIGKTDFNFFPQHLAKQYFDDEQSIMQSGISLINHEEVCTYKMSDDIRWNLTTKVPLIDSNGLVKGLIGINRDITDRKKAEAEIKLKNEELYTANFEKDKFFSIIAHDLRSPFNVFLGFTRIMVEDLDNMTLEQIRKIVVSMRKSATNLYCLLENLLEWSMMQRGVITYTPVSILLALKIKEIIELIIGSVQKKGIEISYNIPDGLSVFADLHMVESIINNLISNAVKYTPKGGKICLSAYVLGDKTVEISIKDTGIGMNKNMIDNLFNLDERTNRKGTEGEPTTGLGLIICKEFIEKHGGMLWMESEVGKGSTFYFTLTGSCQ